MIHPFGEHALLVELETPSRAQALAAALARDPLDGVEAVVPGRASVLVELEPARASQAEAIAEALAARHAGLGEVDAGRRRRVIPVVYGGEHGPDLEQAATLAGLTAAELVERHAAAYLRVLFCGFAPGFAYIGDLPAELQVPRLDTPRTHTPPGSVAIAGPMTGVYPADLPGGWRIIGRTPLALFDPHREPPTYLAPGDAVRFEPVGDAAWARSPRPADDWR